MGGRVVRSGEAEMIEGVGGMRGVGEMRGELGRSGDSWEVGERVEERRQSHIDSPLIQPSSPARLLLMPP